MRILFKLLTVVMQILFSIALLCTGVAAVLTTHWGTVKAYECLQVLLPGQLSIGEIQGALFNDLTVQAFSYSNRSVVLTGKRIHVTWTPLNLFYKRLTINTLQANDFVIQLIDPRDNELHKADENDVKILPWLKHLDLQHVQIDRLQLINHQKTIPIIQTLSINQDDAGIDHVELQSSYGKITGQYHLNLASSIQWSMDLSGEKINPSLFSSATGAIDFRLQGQGEWGNAAKKMAVHLQQLTGKINQYVLQGGGDFTYENGALLIQQISLSAGHAKLAIAGSVKDRWDIKWTLVVPDLHQLLPDGRGLIDSSGSVVGEKEKPQINANLTIKQLKLRDLRISHLAADVQTRLIPHLTIKGNVTIGTIAYATNQLQGLGLTLTASYLSPKLITQWSLALSSKNKIDGIVTLPRYTSLTDLSQAVEGDVTFAMNDIQEFLKGIKDISNPQGQLTGKLQIGGTLNQPSYLLNAALKNGQVSIKKTGTSLRAINLTGTIKQNEPLVFNGQLLVGSSPATLSGSVDVSNKAYPLALTLSGSNLPLINLKQYKVTITPNVKLTYQANELSLSGTVLIPSATIKPKDMTGAVSLPAEVVFVDEPQASAPVIPLNTTLDLEVTLGKDISINYDNLHTSLAGKITINQHPGSPPTASGELHTVRGKYQAYGKLLKILNGRIVYTGNTLTNPGLDIRAAQEIEAVSLDNTSQSGGNELQSVYAGTSTITVGVWVKGTISSPIITLYSDPGGLSQADILSYLMFGYPQSQVSGASSLALLNALSSKYNVGNGKAGGVTDSLKKSLGLSQVNIGTTQYYDPTTNSAASATSVTIGKKLSKKLTMQYSVGVFAPVSVFSLRYQINRYLAVQSQTSTLDNGADILYEYESE